MQLDEDVTEVEVPSARQSGALKPEPVTVQEEREELERVLQHPAIQRSTNLVRFLQFICGKYFEGEAEDIRERTVAVEALGRKETTFDSHADPIVRVTARDLRKKLGDYYENEGSDNSVQIVLPRGRYIPQFVRKETRAAACPQMLDEAVTPGAMDGEAMDTSVVSAAPRKSAWWKSAAATLAVGAAFASGVWVGRRQAASSAINVPMAWGTPVWADDFDGSAHQGLNPAHWVNDDSSSNHPGSPCAAGANCASASHNVFLDGAGHLVLRASRNPDGSWTTAKLTTRGVKNFQYGRIEARMKLPVGAGLWPAFWMMGANFPKVGWPAAGSVDVMENVAPQHGADGLGPDAIRSTLHGPSYFGQTGLWHDYKLPAGERVDNAFHTYGILWSPQRIQFYLDDPANVYFERDAGNLPKGAQWVFDQPFYLVMDLAVGGEWPGSADNTTPNPADMVVDYVRVYALPSAPHKGTFQ